MKYTWTLIFIFIMIGCAQQRPLSGGIKDTTSPTILAVYPKPLSTNFNSNTIEFQFDEYVQLNNIYQELIISPPLKTQPIIKVKKKSVVVELKEPLKENTTYTFNFGDGVVDVNESNKVKDLIYVFSTGDQLDSLVVVGKTLFPVSNEQIGGIKIMLFEDSVDIVHGKNLTPSYFARTFPDGTFVIPYLPEGHFQLMALDDGNGNYRADPEERVSLIAACAPQVRDTVSMDEKVMSLYPQLPTIIDITSYDVDSTGRLAMPWNPAYENRIPFDIKSLNSSFSNFTYFTPERDTLFYQLVGAPEEKGVKVSMQYGTDIDTLEIPFYKSEFKTKLKLSHSVGARIRASDSIYFETMVPIATWDFDKMKLSKDSVEQTGIAWNTLSSFEVSSKPAFIADSKYQMVVLPGFAVDIAGNTNDTLKINFTTNRAEDLGSLIIEVGEYFQHPEGWLEVRDKSDLVIWKEKVSGRNSISILNIKPNEYSVVYFEDLNANEFWDALDFEAQKEAEKIILQPTKFNVRANWEMKVKLELPK